MSCLHVVPTSVSRRCENVCCGVYEQHVSLCRTLNLRMKISKKEWFRTLFWFCDWFYRNDLSCRLFIYHFHIYCLISCGWFPTSATVSVVQRADLFNHTLDCGDHRSFVVLYDSNSCSIYRAADGYQTILPSWKDHMTCTVGDKKKFQSYNWMKH